MPGPLSNPATRTPRAHFAGRLATGLVATSEDPAVLDQGGWWAVVITFEGEVRLWRFAHHAPALLPTPDAAWPGIPGPWRSTIDRADFGITFGAPLSKTDTKVLISIEAGRT